MKLSMNFVAEFTSLQARDYLPKNKQFLVTFCATRCIQPLANINLQFQGTGDKKCALLATGCNTVDNCAGNAGKQ